MTKNAKLNYTKNNRKKKKCFMHDISFLKVLKYYLKYYFSY